MKKNFLLLVLLCFAAFANAQKIDPKVKAVNNYIDFTNDCIHGITIAHLMMQSFNNEVNTYVDATDGFVFKNTDFGRDVFSEISYYEHRGMSPSEFFPRLKSEGSVLGPDAQKFNDICAEIFSLSKKLNDLRFETGEYIARNDVKQKEHLTKVYQKLELGVKYFDQIYVLRNKLENLVETIPLKSSTDEKNTAYRNLRKSYSATTDFLKEIRQKKDINLRQLLLVQQRSLAPLKDILIDPQKMKSIVKNSNKAHEKALAFKNDGSVPKDYIRYGKFYYYYNNILTSTINTVASGVSFTCNRFLDDNNYPFVHFLDMPPMFKVLYPKKLKAPDVIASSDDNIEELPQVLKDRKIKEESKKLVTKNDVLRVELFDHKLLDGDKVSLNFNGDWVLENQSIEEKPIKLKLKLNTEGKNFILLHAVDEGIVPQVTVGFSYFDDGKKKTQLLKSDLNTSTLMEIIFSK